MLKVDWHEEEFEDTKDLIRIRKSKKNNGQRKRTNNDIQTYTYNWSDDKGHRIFVIDCIHYEVQD